MKIIKPISALAICMFICLQLSSCYDDREMNELAYVIALGIDNSENGYYNYTFQISNPLASGGGGEEKPAKEINSDESGDAENNEQTELEITDNKNPGVTEVVVRAKDYPESVSIVNNIISKQINLSHIKVIALSEEVCRDGIEKHTDFLMSEREIRPGTNIIVAEKSAEYFLKNVNPKLDMSTAKYYELLINDENMTYSKAVELREFFDNGIAKNKVDGILPLGGVSTSKKSADFSNYDEKNLFSGNVAELANEKTEFFGAAVINDMKMVGKLNGNEVKYFRLILGELKDSGIFSVEGETFAIKNRKKSKIVAAATDDTPKITIDIYAEVENAKNTDKIKETTEKEIYELLIKTAKEYKADIFGFSNYAKRSFLTQKEFENYDWDKKYENSEFFVNMHIKNSSIDTSRYIFE